MAEPKLNDAGIALIKEFEGLRLDAYPDPATGGEPITIGIGHTTAAGSPIVRMGMTITKQEAVAILKRDLVGPSAHVRRKVTVPLNDNQFSALVSFVFNLGAGNFDKSTLLKKLNAGDYEGAAKQFKRWNRAAGKVMAGLTRRRKAEEALFRSAATNAPETPKPAPAPSSGGLWALVEAIIGIIQKLLGK